MAMEFMFGKKDLFQDDLSGLSNTDLRNAFQGYLNFKKRVGKSMYFASKLTSTAGLSLPLTDLAVKSFTVENEYKADVLDLFDLDSAAEIARNSCVAPTALIMALVYLRRLSVTNPEYLRSTKPRELFLVSLMIASKFLQDEGEEGVYNDEWAYSSNIDIKRLNKLEVQFLLAIDWKINVSQQEFASMFCKIERRLALSQGLFRGWFTYTELAVVQPLSLSWKNLFMVVDPVFQVFATLSVLYATVTATIWVTTFLPSLYALSENTLYWKLLQETQPQHANESALPMHLPAISHSVLDKCNLSDIEPVELNILNYVNSGNKAVKHDLDSFYKYMPSRVTDTEKHVLHETVSRKFK